MLRREECRVSTSTPPLRSNLSFTRRRVNLAQTPSATWLVFPRTRLFCIEEKRRVANPEHARPEYRRSFSRGARQKLAPSPNENFLNRFRVFFKWPPPRMPPWADRAAHGGTMHGGHVDRWTERATSNLGASHSGACLRAYPAPRDAVRVHASSPRKRAIRASHSASLPCRDPGSDADLPPSARRPRRRGPARRVHRTRGRRVPHAVGVPAGTRTARTRAFAKRVTKTRDDFVFGVFSTTALTTFSSPSRRRVAVETPTTRFLTTTHTD